MNEKLWKAIDVLADGVITPAVALHRLQVERDRYPDQPLSPREQAVFDEERNELLAVIRAADSLAIGHLRDYQRDELAKARALRAAAEAERNPQERMADELERQRLTASKVGADDFVAQAKEMLAAGQPRRAALLLAVAEDKGAKITPELQVQVADALDASDPKREEALEIERAVAANSAGFLQDRYRMLAKYGVGIRDDGSAGTGAPGQAASASIRAKMAVWRRAQAEGTAYVEPEVTPPPVPDLSKKG
jgi:hypothetical protein